MKFFSNKFPVPINTKRPISMVFTKGISNNIANTIVVSNIYKYSSNFSLKFIFDFFNNLSPIVFLTSLAIMNNTVGIERNISNIYIESINNANSAPILDKKSRIIASGTRIAMPSPIPKDISK